MISTQQSFLPGFVKDVITPKPVNVSVVPQRSPFRYPGGKTWFVPTFRNWVESIYPKPEILIEPFAGGGIISLTALFENLVDRVVMVELDRDVAAVWHAVVDGHTDWLAKRILEFDLNRESLIQELSRTDTDIKERAFQTILKNRTNHGGILAKGSGLIKHGEKGKGIHSRWYPGTLARRFTEIALIADRISFYQQDGLSIIQEYSESKNVIYFIDPPYTAGGKKAGRRLYKHCELDHEHLFSLCENVEGNFLMTYDNADEVKTMARSHGFQMRLIPMSNTHNTTMQELVIGRDLSWMDKYPAVHEPKSTYK